MNRVMLIVLLAGVLALAGVSAADDADGRHRQLELRLHQAVFRTATQQPDSPVLHLSLRLQQGRWQRVVGTAGHFSRAIHLGFVTDSELEDDAIRLSMRLDVRDDSWTNSGGWAEYDVTLRRDEDGSFVGRYSGQFRDKPVEGIAEGQWAPPFEAPDGFRPITAGEHPRILFRKEDIPELREKLDTPLGEAWREKADDGIGLGILYQLTGEREYAEQARRFVERLLEGDYSGVYAPGSHHGMLHWGPVWEQAGVTYDLCYDAWDEEFRGRVERFITMWTQRIFYHRTMFNTQGIYNYGSAEAGWYYYGPALSCLALWGEPGEEPVKPIEYDAVEQVPPAEDYRPTDGVPVVSLEPGKSPSQWLASPPINAWIKGDFLTELGGLESARPRRGDAFTFGGRPRRFEPLDEKFIPYDGGVLLNIGKSLQPAHVQMAEGPEIIADGPLTMCLYAVLDNDRPRWVRVSAPQTSSGKQQFILNGHTLAHGQVVKLDEGLYPLMVVLRIDARWTTVAPKLEAAGQEDLADSRELLRRLGKQYEDELAEWRYDVEQWQRSGADQQFAKLFAVTRYAMYLHAREALGNGAGQGETSGEHYDQNLMPATYDDAHVRCFGFNVTSQPDMEVFLGRRMFAHWYPQDGPPHTKTVNGAQGLGGGYFATNFPLSPQQWKPTMLWGWRRFLDISDSSDLPAILRGQTGSVVHRAFVNYPQDMRPQPPAGVLPLAWEAPSFGWYGFRNAFEDEDDFLVQVYGRCRSGHGYSKPNAGDFRIEGLGHTWANTLESLRLHNIRSLANVVLLPEDDINEFGRGRLAYAHTEEDGSGVVTFDLSEVYATAQTDERGRKRSLYYKYGDVRIPGGLKDSGITGLRSFGVDYSGAGGAECVFAVVDRIDGGGPKHWMWRLPPAETDRDGDVVGPSVLEYTRVEGDTVVVERPDGTSMQLVFVSPGEVDVTAEHRSVVYRRTYNRGEGEKAAPGIYADSEDGRFFVIATIQQGEPPEITVEGEGLDAVVHVGGQTISFDGEKVVFGK
ncbi:MAG: hypothetical protein ACP5HU_10705 [Phycisphaerae bacterium]